MRCVRLRNSEPPPLQYASEPEDARTEQHDAAGLRSRAARAGQRERFRRNRAQGVLKGFRHVESGPLVRSSYPADEQADEGMRIG